MKYQNLNEAVETLKKLEQTMAAYNHVLGVLYLDATTVAPKGTAEGRGQTMGIMSGIVYDLIANPDNGELLTYLESHKEELDAQTKREVEVFRKQYDQYHKIPQGEYIAYNVLINDAQSVWEKAKNTNDFELFAPYLEKIVDYNRKFAGYYNEKLAPYDALLNEYEEGLTMKTLDAFFAQLRETIVPLVSKIQNTKPINAEFLNKNYPIEKQREFSDYLMDVLGMDRNYAGIGETEHPYTTNFNNKDVRITTHYYENALDSSMYSVIHEAGHAIYELDCDDCYNYTFLAGGVSMGIHESQSRFYENLIGRSYEFISYIYPKMQELFMEQLADVSAEDFYKAVNKVQPSLIRTEADELTYCLHIMVRYELEKKLIDGSLKVKDIPRQWNRLYKEYLGIDVPDDTRGCLQDSHWSGGSIGYFPSYALGSAYGPQMLDAMKKEIRDVMVQVKNGNLMPMRNWLKEHFHKYACFFKPRQLFNRTCGKFDAKYYTDYLKDKFTKLYDL